MNQEDLLAQMNGRTITNGWDVVCAMSAERISKLFEEKYNEGDKSGLLYEIKHTEKFALGSVSFDFHIGPPLISFIQKDPTRCTLRLEIKDGVADIKDKSGVVVESQKIPDGPDDKKHYYITAIVPLAVIKGKVETDEDVVINFDQTESVRIDLMFDDMIIGQVTNALKNYFTKNLEKKSWSLGKLIYTQNPELIHLTPTNFEFATSVNPSKDTDTGCLLLFITTKDGNKGTANELTGKDGRLYTPYPDDHSAALIISSRLLFTHIIGPQFKDKTSLDFEAKKGSTGLDAWSLQGSGKIDCGRIDHDQEQDIIVPLDNFQVISDNKNTLSISWKQSWENKVQYWSSYVVTGQLITVKSTGYVLLEISVKDPSYSFSVSDADKMQSITCSSSADLIVSGDQPEFFENSEFTWMKAEAKRMIYIKIKPMLIFNLRGVDIFAVSNLLLPADHVITYDSNGVYVPGDLVIFGTTKSKL